jgi:cysteine sulfinate desulfinase/cysteine desulfurase-like protein
LAAGFSHEIIDSALRVSFGDFNTERDVDGLIAGLAACRAELVGASFGA